MADTRLRSLERRAQESGDLQVAAQLIQYRARTGEIPPNHILYAAHLGDESARFIHPRPRILIDCPNCRARREIRNRRNRDPRPRPLSMETPRHCMKCNGSEQAILDKGLIKFVQQVEDVPHRLLVAWAADCAEHQQLMLSPRNPLAYQGRYRLPNQPERNPTLTETVLPMIRQWLQDGTVDPYLYQAASTNSGVYTNVGVPSALATMVALAGIEEQERKVRWRAAEIASAAYHAAGGTRLERDWQEQRIIRYLLGYLG